MANTSTDMLVQMGGKITNEEWRFKVKRFSYILVLIMISSCVRAEGDPWGDSALILVKPVSVEHLETLDDVSAATGRVLMGEKFRLKFTLVAEIYGNFPKEETITTIIATHKESLTNNDLIYLFISRDKEEFRVRYWGVPSEIACIPKKMADKAGISRDFAFFMPRKNHVCADTSRLR